MNLNTDLEIPTEAPTGARTVRAGAVCEVCCVSPTRTDTQREYFTSAVSATTLLGGFLDDVVKTNSTQMLSQADITDVRSI